MNSYRGVDCSSWYEAIFSNVVIYGDILFFTLYFTVNGIFVRLS